MDGAIPAARIRSMAESRRYPDGSPYLSLSIASECSLVEASGRSHRLVQIDALDAGVSPERYARSAATLSLPDQKKLLQSTVAMVGLGGLGGLLLDAMARMGVGRIRGADGDGFEESNLNRQALASPETLGVSKAESAAKRAKALNPAVEVAACAKFLGPADMGEFVAGADVVVDALGGLKDRSALQQAAAAARIPMVSAAVAGWTGWVGTVMPGDRGPADFFGAAAGDAQNTLGCPAPTVNIASNMQCAEVLRFLAGGSPALAGKMLLFDLQDMTFETIAIA